MECIASVGTEKRMEGVLNVNRIWLIPKDAKKPADARKKVKTFETD